MPPAESQMSLTHSPLPRSPQPESPGGLGPPKIAQPDNSVSGLQLLAHHIGKIGGEMPKLRAGDRWKIQRQISQQEGDISGKLREMDNDWE
jgi:hypothetical protein